MAQRTPFFCSGCPHNSSTTVADEDTLVGAGIGCHTMVLLNPRRAAARSPASRRWAARARSGSAPRRSPTPRHFVQNLGDGTFHHSGSLAIRAAVAAGVNVTYKLLYNDTVAMTGGQDVEGQLAVARADPLAGARGRRADRSSRPRTRRATAASTLAAIAEVRDRDELLAPSRSWPQVAGVTVLIHDQECAAELRRARKRGKAAEPPQRVWINERVCEGCGDCGEKSELPVGASRSRPSSAARRRSTRPPATRTSRASRATARRSSTVVAPAGGARTRRRAARRRAARARRSCGADDVRVRHDRASAAPAS